jgi:hypothetical protein
MRALSWFLNLNTLFLNPFGIPEVASVISQGIKESEFTLDLDKFSLSPS